MMSLTVKEEKELQKKEVKKRRTNFIREIYKSRSLCPEKHEVSYIYLRSQRNADSCKRFEDMNICTICRKVYRGKTEICQL